MRFPHTGIGKAIYFTSGRLLLLLSISGIIVHGSSFGSAENEKETSFGILKVRTVPSNADVYIEGYDARLGKTPFTTGLKQGKYRLILRLDSYSDFDSTIDIAAGSTNEITAIFRKDISGTKTESALFVGDITPEIESQIRDGKINSRFGILEIISKPSDAEVYINDSDEPWGKTRYTTGLIYGVYRVKIKRDSYLDFDTTVVINVGTRTKVHTKLIKDEGILRITTDPPGAIISIDNKPVGRSPLEFETFISGDYGIKAVLDGHFIGYDSVHVVYGELSRVHFDLKEQISGVIVFTDPPDATVIIDGIEYEPGKAIELPEGFYEIIATRHGYVTVATSIEVKNKAINAVNLTLKEK